MRILHAIGIEEPPELQPCSVCGVYLLPVGQWRTHWGVIFCREHFAEDALRRQEENDWPSHPDDEASLVYWQKAGLLEAGQTTNDVIPGRQAEYRAAVEATRAKSRFAGVNRPAKPSERVPFPGGHEVKEMVGEELIAKVRDTVREAAGDAATIVSADDVPTCKGYYAAPCCYCGSHRLLKYAADQKCVMTPRCPGVCFPSDEWIEKHPEVPVRFKAPHRGAKKVSKGKRPNLFG